MSMSTTLRGEIMAQGPPTQYYDRDPIPVVDSGSAANGTTTTVQYQNGTEEVSEIRQIKVICHGDVTIGIKREEDNQEQTVAPPIPIKYLNRDEAGHPIYEFRKTSRDKPLTIRKNQTLYVNLVNNTGIDQDYFCIIDKERMAFYTPQEVTQEAARGR